MVPILIIISSPGIQLEVTPAEIRLIHCAGDRDGREHRGDDAERLRHGNLFTGPVPMARSYQQAGHYTRSRHVLNVDALNDMPLAARVIREKHALASTMPVVSTIRRCPVRGVAEIGTRHA